MRRTSHHVILCCAIAAAPGVLAGPLSPPLGPVTPTYKTLTEVEPRTAITAANTPGDNDATPSVFQIATPGSYYLTGDVIAPAGRIAIEIVTTAGAVTIDLNGFRLQGSGTLANVAGIDLGRANNVTILNGSIIGFSGSGINGPNSTDCRVEGVRVLQSRECGLRLSDGAIVRACEFTSNGLANGANKHGCEVGNSAVVTAVVCRNNLGDGLNAGESGTIADCTFRANSLSGMSAGAGGTVRNCTAHLNASHGFIGGASTAYTGCTARNNTGDGIQASFDSVVAECIASNNTQDGIRSNITCVVTHSAAYQNGVDGISAGINSAVANCVSYDNTNKGFVIGSSGSIINCTASVNGGSGIELFYGAASIDCASQLNTLHGISAVDRCTITGSTCVRNGAGGVGSGISVVGNTGRIEGNACVENDRGIQIVGLRNFVVRNTCMGNTTANWDIAANNVCGPILNRSAPASAAILGDSAPSSLGTTDANANFTH